MPTMPARGSMPRNSLLLRGFLAMLLWIVGVLVILRPPQEQDLAVSVSMASTMHGALQLFVDDGKGFREELSQRRSLVGDSEFRTYRFRARAIAGVRRLRIDPPSGSGTIVIESIELKSLAMEDRYEGADLLRWQSQGQAAEVELDPSGRLMVEVSTGDAQLVLASGRPGARFAGWFQAIGLMLAGFPLIWLLSGGHRSLPRRSLAFLALISPMALFWFLNRRALQAWWIGDDPCHLIAISDHGLWRPFFRSIGYFLTPWLNLSLGADFLLFGLQPRGFYMHQLVAYAVLVLVAYVFLRLFLTPPSCSLALSLFVVSAPSFAVTQLLMNRHYLEGLILTLAALYLYRRAITQNHLCMAICGSGLYLLATATKEVFVPLVFVLPLLSGGKRRSTVRHATPFVVSALVYGVWRFYMLGWSNTLSAYGDEGRANLDSVLSLPDRLGFAGAWFWVATMLVALALLQLGLRSRRAALGFLISLPLVVLPLVPVLSRLEPRHFFLPALVLSVLLAVALDRRREAAIGGTCLLLIALFALSQSTIWNRLELSSDRYQSEGQFVLDRTEDGWMFTSANHSMFHQCLAQLREEFLELPEGPRFCGDACFCTHSFPDEPMWRYGDQGVLQTKNELASTCAIDRDLEVDLVHDATRKRLVWSFGPYEEGQYAALLVSGSSRQGSSLPIPLARTGEMPYWLFDALRFVIRYRAPGGWTTYSPVFRVENGERAVVEN